MQDNTTLEAPAPRLIAEAPVSNDATSSLHRWMARELHDVVVQPVTAALVELELVRANAGVLRPERADVLQRDLRAALHGLRALMGQLRGEDGGPDDLVRSVTDIVAEVRERTGIDAQLVVSTGWPAHLGADTSRNLRRIVEEALRNVVRHSGALRVEVRLEEVRGALRVSVTDDGTWAAGGTAGTGILGMHERAVVIGGVLTVDHAPNGSTVAVNVDGPDAGSATR